MTEPTQTVVLLRRWHEGDEKALHRILEQELPWIRERVQKRLGPLLHQIGEAEDYVQEAMVRVLSYGPRFRLSDRDQFRGLMAVLIENTLRDEHQFHRRERRDPDRAKPMTRDSVLDLDPPRRGVTRPSAVAQREEEKAWLELSMELLPVDENRLVRLRTWDGLSFAEIAEQLGTTENAARMRHSRALSKMAQNFIHLRAGGLETVLAERLKESATEDHGCNGGNGV